MLTTGQKRKKRMVNLLETKISGPRERAINDLIAFVKARRQYERE